MVAVGFGVRVGVSTMVAVLVGGKEVTEMVAISPAAEKVVLGLVVEMVEISPVVGMAPGRRSARTRHGGGPRSCHPSPGDGSPTPVPVPRGPC